MWKPTTVAKAVKFTHFGEELAEAEGGSKGTRPHSSRSGGKALQTYRGGYSRPPSYSNRYKPRGNARVTVVSQASSRTQESPGRTRGSFNRGSKGSRGRNSS